MVKVSPGMTLKVFYEYPPRRIENLPRSEDSCRFKHGEGWVSKKYRCGHIGWWNFTLSIYGTIIGPKKDNDLCHECLLKEIAKTAIRCALCKLPIFFGSSVAAYPAKIDGAHLDVATYIDDDTVLGCLRWDCCVSPGLFMMGHWGEKGFQPNNYDQ